VAKAKKEFFMEIKIFSALPPEGRRIREEVFVIEQGFQEEFDGTDLVATHILLYEDGIPVAVCRIFPHGDSGQYLAGRVAVLKSCRGRGLGAALMKAAEDQVRQMGGRELRLHAQCRIRPFYEAVGYTPYGEIEDDQGCPHIWMKKSLHGV
jgi:predicted GNAT family N-acyltransferase